MNHIDDLFDFLEKNNVEVSFQSKRDFTDIKKLREYILDLEGAVRLLSRVSLDKALAEYRESKRGEK